MRHGRQRRSIRLPEFDYSWPNPYFVTVCTHLRRCLLGEVAGNRVRLTEAGRLALTALRALPSRFGGIVLDAHVIMPNHVHGVFVLRPNQGRGPALGEAIRVWKASTSRAVRTTCDPSFGWQRNYWDRIIRDPEEFERIRHYIRENPRRWNEDVLHPDRVPM